MLIIQGLIQGLLNFVLILKLPALHRSCRPHAPFRVRVGRHRINVVLDNSDLDFALLGVFLVAAPRPPEAVLGDRKVESSYLSRPASIP